MKRVCLATAVVVAALCVLPLSARGETAQQAFATGETLLAKANFQGALGAFARAARADRANQEYLQHYAMVRRVVMLRQQLDAEKDPAQWEYIARGLRAFYIGQRLHGEALAVDQRMHAKLNNASSAVLLAETQLAMDRNAEAAETLSSLPAAEQTASTRSLLGLALARQGKIEDARQIAADLRSGDDAGPGMIYRMARLHAAVGSDDQALSLLTRCFEGVAPSRLDAFKEHARLSPEFAALASAPAFDAVMKTESKVAESKCSGGSRCAGCPMRGKCSGGNGQ
jgi:tetratricopeptide (TPR) repeat protein